MSLSKKSGKGLYHDVVVSKDIDKKEYDYHSLTLEELRNIIEDMKVRHHKNNPEFVIGFCTRQARDMFDKAVEERMKELINKDK